MNIFKLQFFTALMFLFSTTAFGQSKKQQIEKLTIELDSAVDYSLNLRMQLRVQRKINDSISSQINAQRKINDSISSQINAQRKINDSILSYNQKLSNKLSDINDSIQRCLEWQEYMNLKYKAHGLSSVDFQVFDVMIRDKRRDPYGMGNEYSERVRYWGGKEYVEISGYEFSWSFLYIPSNDYSPDIESLKKDLAIEKYKRGSGHKFFKDWEELYEYYQEDSRWAIFKVSSGSPDFLAGDREIANWVFDSRSLQELHSMLRQGKHYKIDRGFLVQMGGSL
jgi:hypothetical protein